MTNNHGELPRELLTEKFTVIPYEDEEPKNCLIIPEGSNFDLDEICQAAVKNNAWVDNSDDEAGDDLYAIQFPGHEQELLEQDQISARLRELNNDDDME